MNTQTTLWAFFAAVALTCGGCTGDKVPGKYAVVDIDKTIDAIEDVPVALSKRMALPEYREQVRKRYADKTLEFTTQHPHEFLLAVPLEGTVLGLLYGGWTRDEKDKSVVLIYQWLSGPMYTLWGRATLSNGVLTVKLDDGPVLFLRKPTHEN